MLIQRDTSPPGSFPGSIASLMSAVGVTDERDWLFAYLLEARSGDYDIAWFYLQTVPILVYSSARRSGVTKGQWNKISTFYGPAYMTLDALDLRPAGSTAYATDPRTIVVQSANGRIDAYANWSGNQVYSRSLSAGIAGPMYGANVDEFRIPGLLNVTRLRPDLPPGPPVT